MKYSDLKKAVLRMREAGYCKWRVGQPYFHKRWEQGIRDYNQLVSVNEIIYSLLDIEWIIDKYEEKAKRELEKQNDEECY